MKLELLTAEPARPAMLGIAVRPTLLFVVAFALNITPHEAVHALVAYLLGFASTLFQMWVNPDAASATPIQLALIAAAGPIFSLTVGLISWLLYKKVYKWKPPGLFFLMMAMVGIYSFLGPVAGAAFGGDFNIALTFLGISRIIQIVASATGLVLLSLFNVLYRKRTIVVGTSQLWPCEECCFHYAGALAGRHRSHPARLLATTEISCR